MQVSDILIPLLFLIVLGGMAWWLSSAKKKGHTARSRMAEMNGWHYEAGSDIYKIGDDKKQSNILYRLSGGLPNGKPWLMEARIRMEVDQTGLSEQTVWQTPQGDITLLLMRRSSLPVPVEMKSAILRKNGMDIELGRLHSIEIAGLSTPSDQYEAYTDESEKSRDVLERAFAFIDYFSGTTANLSVCVTPGNTAVRLPNCIEKPADMEAVVRLGLSLCQ